MKKNYEPYVSKIFFTSKLTLALVLLFTVFRTVFLPERIKNTLASTSTPVKSGLRVNETENLKDLSSADYAEIVEKNPFGISSQTAGINEQESFTPVISDELKLELFGTVSGSPEVARAIIKNCKTGIFDLYKIGQIVDGARIEEIGTDKIILVNDGKKQILRMNIAQLGGKGQRTKTPMYRTINEINNATKTDSIPQTAKTEIGCVEALLNKAVIEPYIVDSQVEGLRVTDLENVEEAKYFGLKNGDIIHAVNGHTLTNKQKAHQIFKKASSQATISLEILRDDKIKKFSFDLR